MLPKTRSDLGATHRGQQSRARRRRHIFLAGRVWVGLAGYRCPVGIGLFSSI